jgi:hypothetical protein
VAARATEPMASDATAITERDRMDVRMNLLVKSGAGPLAGNASLR